MTNAERTVIAVNLSRLADTYNRVSVSKIKSSSLSDVDKMNAIVEFETLINDLKTTNTNKIELPNGHTMYFNVQRFESHDIVDNQGVVTKKTRMILSKEEYDVRREQAACLTMISRLQPAGIPIDKYQTKYTELVERELSWTSLEELNFAVPKPATA